LRTGPRSVDVTSTGVFGRWSLVLRPWSVLRPETRHEGPGTIETVSDSPEERLKALRAAIRHHEEQYYLHNAPEISDEAFDRLMHELEPLEAEYPDLVTPDSPTQRVGGRPVEGFSTVQHLVPMLSLDNAYTEEELQAFDERVRRGAGLGQVGVPYVAELKID